MSDKTGIEWTDATWNPVRGCSRVSPGCVNCYAERVAARFSGTGQPYEGLAERRLKVLGEEEGRIVGRWTGKVRFVADKLGEPLAWKRPRRVFVNSMSDLFHEGLSDEDIAAVFSVMARAHRHTFQVLTKRADRMREWVSGMASGDTKWRAAWLRGTTHDGHSPRDPDERFRISWPLPNVWLGVSVEDQQRADERIPVLLETPAAVRFVSAEPLLGPVMLQGRHTDEHVTRIRSWLSSHRGYPSGQAYKPPTIDWVIIGCESGPGARPMQREWALSLLGQCSLAHVPVFFKQAMRADGKLVKLPEIDGRTYEEFPER